MKVRDLGKCGAKPYEGCNGCNEKQMIPKMKKRISTHVKQMNAIPLTPQTLLPILAPNTLLPLRDPLSLVSV